MRNPFALTGGILMLAVACGGATSSTGTGGGGSTGTGGSAGSGQGGGGTGGSAPTMCPGVPVTFELMAAGAPAFTYCTGSGCSVEWLSIKSAAGQAFQIYANCQGDCASCQQIGCPALCALPQPIKPEGARTVWDGNYFTPGMCGQGVSCINPNCAPAGHYIATMCAAVKNNQGEPYCMTDETAQQCVDVEFDYPTTAVVQGTVGPIK